MFELLTTLEDALVLSFYIDYYGDYHVTQFEDSAELDAFLASADVVRNTAVCHYYLFGSIWIVVNKNMRKDK